MVEEAVVGAYTAVAKSVIRAGFAMDSAKLGILEVGTEVTPHPPKPITHPTTPTNG